MPGAAERCRLGYVVRRGRGPAARQDPGRLGIGKKFTKREAFKTFRNARWIQIRTRIEIVWTLAKGIRILNGNFSPYLLINYLQRIKLDANREKEEDPFEIPQAEKAWGDFIKFMRSAELQMIGGLLVDIHG
ncbi:unnamed protein product [Caretta caretta]